MIVLAIDPGSITAGYALLRQDGRKITYLKSGIIRFNQSDDFLERVKEIHEKTQELILSFEPDEIALESLIYVKSPTALIKLAQARGVMLAALSTKYHQRIFEYSPNLVKSTVTGHGHADKQGVQKFLHTTLGLSEFKSHDESDAIAIALCHLLSRQTLVKNLSSIKPSKSKGRGLAKSLQHKIKGKVV
jgi:crossover junction endodeoxyribonuclease RuvC